MTEVMEEQELEQQALTAVPNDVATGKAAKLTFAEIEERKQAGIAKARLRAEERAQLKMAQTVMRKSLQAIKKQHGIHIEHRLPYNFAPGLTVAWAETRDMVMIATAACSKKDQFCKLTGEELAVRRLVNGELIYLPKTDGCSGLSHVKSVMNL